MIRVPGDNPMTVSFVQKGVEKENGRIASEQVAKAASAEVIARTEFENAHYRLTKATEALSATEIAYHEAVAKSAWNKEQVRSSYNNALAGFRDADKTAEIAAEKFALAKAALAGLRLVAKAEISNGEELKAAVKNAKTPEDRKACVVAAEKMKLLFFLPKGWKAEADKMQKSTFSPAERTAFVEAEKKALSIKDKEPHVAMEILNNIADALATEAGQAKQSGDMLTFQRLAAEGGRVRGLAIRIRQEGFDNKFPVQDVKDIATLPLEVVGKREFSDTKRENLAEKGNAMPDGSFPVVTVADLKNAIGSIGRAKDYDAVKAFLIRRAGELKATDALPEAWVSTKKSIMKEVIMPDAKILVICPECGGDGPMGCPCCGGEKLVPQEAHDEAMGYGEMMMKSANPFSTKSLLTRDFEKSAGYQNYIFTKGGPGSGAQPGHTFNGNQHTGGMSSGGRLVHEREGHKVTMKRYTEGTTAHKSAAEAQKTIARGHESQGRFGKAAEAMRSAAEHHKMAAGFHEGIAGLHGKVHGDEAARSEHRGEAAKQRVYAGRANDDAARLEAMAA